MHTLTQLIMQQASMRAGGSSGSDAQNNAGSPWAQPEHHSEHDNVSYLDTGRSTAGITRTADDPGVDKPEVYADVAYMEKLATELCASADALDARDEGASQGAHAKPALTLLRMVRAMRRSSDA